MAERKMTMLETILVVLIGWGIYSWIKDTRTKSKDFDVSDPEVPDPEF